MHYENTLAKSFIVLKADWDIPVNLPLPGEKARGHFADRVPELDSLTNEIAKDHFLN